MASFLDALAQFGQGLQPLAAMQQQNQNMDNVFKLAQTPAGVNILNAQAGQEASALERLKLQLMAQQGGESPSSVREYQYYNSLPKTAQEEFLKVKRADQMLNLGNQIGIRSPSGQMVDTYQVGVNPNNDPALRGAQRAAEQQAILNTAAPIAQAQATGTQTGQAMTQGAFNLPKLKGSLDSTLAQNKLVLDNIKEAKKLVGYSTAGSVYSQLAQGMRGTDATNLNKILDTVNANIGFDALQQMRDNSPTGGALGGVSEREINYLQSKKVSLSQDQSAAQLSRNLDTLAKDIAESEKRIKAAYDADVKRFGAEAMSGVPNPSAATPGFNPNATSPAMPPQQSVNALPSNGWSIEVVK